MIISRRHIALSLILGFSALSFTQGIVSSQPHEGNVFSIAAVSTLNKSVNETFYTAGSDGFLIKWGDDNLGEHYQLTDLSIETIIKNPVTGDIAIYETNGGHVFRISVIDSKSYARRYTKRFQNPVTALSFSEQGTYLIAATSEVNGCYILDARSGVTVKRIQDISGTVMMAKTGQTEKSAIFYSTTPTGAWIVFYDLNKFKTIKKVNAEYLLEKSVLFGTGKYSNRFLAGIRTESVESGGVKYDYWGKVDKKDYKNVSYLFILDAMTGATLCRYEVKGAVLLASAADSEKEGLYFTDVSDKTTELKLIPSSMLEIQLAKIKQYEDKMQISNVNKAVLNPPEPQIIRSFPNLKNKESFTSGAKDSERIMLGTSLGNIYMLDDKKTEEPLAPECLTNRLYKKICDISSDNENFYLLTKDACFKSSRRLETVRQIFQNKYSSTNIEVLNNTAVLWSKGSAEPVYSINLSEKKPEPEILFTPKSAVQVLHLHDDKIIFIEGDTDVYIFSMKNKNKNITPVYTGTALQDAAIADASTLFIAKTNTSQKNYSLISINLKTGEASSLKFDGSVCYSLSSYSQEGKVFGITEKTEDSKNISELFSYDTKTRRSRVLLRLNEEDSSAFTSLSYPIVYTNLGRNQMYACNAETGRSILYRRSASMPVKTCRSEERLMVLNGNGSVSWYDIHSQGSKGDWYITETNEWFEL